MLLHMSLVKNRSAELISRIRNLYHSTVTNAFCPSPKVDAESPEDGVKPDVYCTGSDLKPFVFALCLQACKQSNHQSGAQNH